VASSRALAVLLLAALLAAPVAAHHSNVAFDVEVVERITGVVERFQWTNPHTWIHLRVDDGSGGTEEWAIEGRPPGVLRRAGWSRDILEPGQTVTVYYSPAKDGSRTGLVARVVLADGTVLANAPPPTR
jgi:hypothetical protein